MSDIFDLGLSHHPHKPPVHRRFLQIPAIALSILVFVGIAFGVVTVAGKYLKPSASNDYVGDGAGTALVPNTPYPHYDFYYAVTRTGEKLAAKGYHAHTDVGQGAGHVDGGMVQATLPDAVLWTWRGYQPAP